MKVYVRVSPFAPVQECVDFTVRCEAAGFDGVGYLDSQMINRDMFVTMALAAAATSRIKVVTAVTNPISRHVSTIASAAATIDDLGRGRVEIWLGRGFTAVNLAGLPYATTKELRESVHSLRGLLRGEWDAIPGAHTRMGSTIGGREVPVVLAAAGPRTLRLAGEVADGVLLTTGMVPSAMEQARSLVAEGARAAGRQPEDVTVWLSLLTCIRPTREEALHFAGPLLANRLEEPDWLMQAGIDTKGAVLSDAYKNLYPDPIPCRGPGAGASPRGGATGRAADADRAGVRPDWRARGRNRRLAAGSLDGLRQHLHENYRHDDLPARGGGGVWSRHRRRGAGDGVETPQMVESARYV